MYNNRGCCLVHPGMPPALVLMLTDGGYILGKGVPTVPLPSMLPAPDLLPARGYCGQALQNSYPVIAFAKWSLQLSLAGPHSFNLPGLQRQPSSVWPALSPSS